MKWIDDFISLVYPRICVTCGIQLFREERQLCISCLSDLPFTGYINMPENPVKKLFTGRINIHHASAWLHFEKANKTQSIMHSLKYKKNPEIGHYFGEMMGRELKESALYKGIQAVIPVPIHRSKLRQRGYNQCEFIARGLAEAMDVVMRSDVLIRKLKNESQTKKKRFQRWENVQSVFRVKKESLKDIEHILLVDDVITTGSTLEACAQQLYVKTSLKISIITLARSA